MDAVYAFCHLRKTGGITFTHILRREFGSRHMDAITRYPNGEVLYRDSDWRTDHWIYWHPRSIAGHGVRPFVELSIRQPIRWLTILRDPLHRYASHFIHHVEHFNYDQSFETWMEIEKHHNDQTKTIAGQADVERAKDLLNQFFWIGFTEDYAISMEMLERKIGNGFSTQAIRKSNVAKGLKFDRKQLVDQFQDQIRERNQLDLQLYEHARQQIWQQQLEWLEQHRQQNPANTAPRAETHVWLSRAKRNLIYKPFVKTTNLFRK